jgi:hypothetical protein
MQVVYSNESGTGDNKKQPITVVTAILLNMDSQWAPVERELSAIKAHIMPLRLLHRSNNHPRFSAILVDSELKGDRLFKGLRGKIPDIPPEKAGEALTHALSVVVKNGVQIFHAAIDRAGRVEWFKKAQAEAQAAANRQLRLQQTDEEEALMTCLMRLDGFVHTHMPKESVL